MQKMSQHREETKQLTIISVIVFMGFLSSSIAYPILPPIFLKNTTHALLPASWSETTRLILLGFTLACFPLGQFIGSPILGRNSDRVGRKKMLLVSLVGCMVGYFLIIMAFQMSCFWLLLAGQLVSGFMESSYTITQALASEFKTISKYQSFGRINSVGSLGYIAGPLLGGFLSDTHLCVWFSCALPFILTLAGTMGVFLLVYWILPNRSHKNSVQQMVFWQQFHIFKQFKTLFSDRHQFKNVMIISTLFTFSVDIFYEFSSVYLTGKWGMTPAMISIYNIALSLALALGAMTIPTYLSKYFSNQEIITYMILLTALILSCMIIFQYPLPMLLFFALIGLSITTATTTITIHLSNMTHPEIQGEVLGIQQSLRTLGDAMICIFGGIMSIFSVLIPIILSCLVAFLASFFSKYVLNKRTNM